MIKHASLFSHLIAVFNRNHFHRLVMEHNAERHSKGFTSWDQFVSILFCQLAQAKSLREICGGLACCVGKLRHLGMHAAPKKSTLSYANAHRPWQMYRALFYQTLATCREAASGKHKFRFKNKLLSMDSTTISLCLSMFPRAKFRKAKGAIKLHLLLDHDGYLPTYAYISNGKKPDITFARKIPLVPGSIIAMDRAYNAYKLFNAWTEKSVFFVTRLKDNADYRVVKNNPVPQNRNILSDQLIAFTGYKAKKDCPHLLRKIVAWDSQNSEEVVLLTNHLEFGATTISSSYKERWQIEVFFKTLKQHLKVKTFVGTSQNALYTQIWAALIAILLIKFLKFKSTLGWSLSNLVALLRWNLFTYRNIWDWTNDPFDVPPIEPKSFQPMLPIKGLGQHTAAQTG